MSSRYKIKLNLLGRLNYDKTSANCHTIHDKRRGILTGLTQGLQFSIIHKRALSQKRQTSNPNFIS